MTSQIGNLVLQDTNFPLLTPTIINQQFLEKDGNVCPLLKLSLLNVALDALQPNPPNSSTVWFDNTVLLQSVGGTNTNTINTSSMTIDEHTTSGPTMTVTAGGFTLNSFGSAQTVQLASTGFSVADTSLSNNADYLSDELRMTNVVGDIVKLSSTSLSFDTDFKISFNSIDGSGTSDMAIVNVGQEIKIGDPDALGHNTQLIVDDNQSVIRAVQPQGTLSVYAGKACRVYLLDAINDHIQIYANYFVSEGTDVYVYPVAHYLGVEARSDGYFFFLFNATGTSITLTTDDGTNFMATLLITPQPTCTVLPYATVRCTLVDLPGFGSKVWSVI